MLAHWAVPEANRDEIMLRQCIIAADPESPVRESISAFRAVLAVS
jgi:hypothetical protein